MTLKSKLLAAGLLVGFTTLGSASALALAAQEIPGEFLTVHSDEVGGYDFTQADRDKLADEIRAQIRVAAIEACTGRDFSIDTPSFKVRRKVWGSVDDPPYFFMSGIARVFCKN